MSTARLTALVPGYLNVGPNPRGMLALVENLDRALGVSTPLAPLHREIESFGQQLEHALAQLQDSESMRDQVRQFEEQYDAGTRAESEPQAGELPTSDELLKGIDDFLRERRDDDLPRNETR